MTIEYVNGDQGGFQENEVSKNASGGTEILKRRLHAALPADVRDQFQVVPSRIRELDNSKIRLFFCNDLPEDPEMSSLKEEDTRRKFHKLIWISDWQYERARMVLGVPYSDHSLVVECGIIPATEVPEKPKDKINIVYTSTPQRGLSILVPVFKHLAEAQKDIHLHVFSSFKIYGWQDDAATQKFFDDMKECAQITHHGAVPNDELRDFLKNEAHIWAYPSIWQETSCQAMMEAMTAKVLCVHPNWGALPLTSGGLNLMYSGDQDFNKHANIFANALNQGLALVRENDAAFQSKLQYIKNYCDQRFDLKKITMQWEYLMRELLTQYADVEKRKVAQKTFRYVTQQRAS